MQELMEESCTLACFPRLVQSALLHNPGPSSEGCHYPQCAGLYPIKHKFINCLAGFPISESYGGILSNGVLSSQITRTYVKYR